MVLNYDKFAVILGWCINSLLVAVKFMLFQAARLPTVTTIELPEGIDWKAVNAYCMNK